MFAFVRNALIAAKMDVVTFLLLIRIMNIKSMFYPHLSCPSLLNISLNCVTSISKAE